MSQDSVPIENIYYLLAYAWDALEEFEVVQVDATQHPALPDLLAAVLANGVEHLIRRGLDRLYVEECQEIPGVRGKLDLSATVKAGTLRRSRTICVVDELSPNILANQILKTTIRGLLRDDRLVSKKTRGHLAGLYRRLRGISEVPLRSDLFSRVRIHRNNRFYGLLIDICRLIHETLLPKEGEGATQFRDFFRKGLPTLFERFIRNFYRRRQSHFKVLGVEWIDWFEASGSEPDLAQLPRMKTDISLEAGNHHVILDAKFYKQALVKPHDQWKARSSHLYQVYAYVLNKHLHAGRELDVDGALLYPVTAAHDAVDLHYEIQGHHFWLQAVDLARPWKTVEQQLLEVAKRMAKRAPA